MDSSRRADWRRRSGRRFPTPTKRSILTKWARSNACDCQRPNAHELTWRVALSKATARSARQGLRRVTLEEVPQTASVVGELLARAEVLIVARAWAREMNVPCVLDVPRLR